MTKLEFLTALRAGLCGLPQSDIDERVAFYAEMIDDRMEEGLSESEAVSAVGSVEDVVDQIVADTPLTRLVQENMLSRRRLSIGVIVLLVLGSPVWLSLLIAAFAVVLSLYAVLWSVIVALWSVFASVAGCAVGGLFGGIAFVCGGYVPSGLAMIAAVLVCGGLSVFTFYGCRAATGGAVLLTKQMVLSIKRACMRKGEVR